MLYCVNNHLQILIHVFANSFTFMLYACNKKIIKANRRNTVKILYLFYITLFFRHSYNYVTFYALPQVRNSNNSFKNFFKRILIKLI